MSENDSSILASSQSKLKLNQLTKSKIKLRRRSPFKNRSPLRDITEGTVKLINATTKTINNNSDTATPGDDQEWTHKPVSTALNPAPSVAFPPPPSVIPPSAVSPIKRRYPSPPNYNYYAQSFRNSPIREKIKPRSKSNDRGSDDGRMEKSEGRMESLRKSAIRDVMRKFKCEDNTIVDTTVVKRYPVTTNSVEKKANDKANGNLKSSPNRMKQRHSDGDNVRKRSDNIQSGDSKEGVKRYSKSESYNVEEAAKRYSKSEFYNVEEAAKRSDCSSGGKNEEETKDSYKSRDQEDDDATQRSSYSSSAVSVTLLRVEIVGLKSQVSDMEAELTENKSTLGKEKQRHNRVESCLREELKQAKNQLEEVKNLFRKDKLNFRTQMNDMNAGLNESKEVCRRERLKHNETEKQLLEKLQTLQKNHYDIAKSEEELQKKNGEFAEELKLCKEQLKEVRRSQKESYHRAKSEEELQRKNQKLTEEIKVCTGQLKEARRSQKETFSYAQKCKTNMDNQLSIWQGEKSKYENEIKSMKEQSMMINKEYSELSEEFKEEKSVLNRKLRDHQAISSMAQGELIKFQNMAKELEKEKDKAMELQNESRRKKQEHTELVHSLRKRIGKLEADITKYKEYSKMKKHLVHEKEEEIDKLKEELKHAQFRVQVLKTEVREASPKKKRAENKSRRSMHDLQEELNMSREEKHQVQTKQEDRFLNLDSKCDETCREIELDVDKSHTSTLSIQERDIFQAKINVLQTKIKTLSKQLNESRSRSRRIAIKSETELAKVRDVEETVEECTDKYDEEAKAWKIQFQEIEKKYIDKERKYKEEVTLRKDIEAILQDKTELLRKDKAENSEIEPSLTPTTFTHNNIDDQIRNLNLAVTRMTARALRIEEESQRQNLMDELDKLKTITSQLEKAVKGALEKSENSLQMLQMSIDTYENRIVKSSVKHEKLSKELQQSLLKQNESVKKQQQAELDLISKCTVLKGRYAQLQQEYENCRMQAEEQEQKHLEVESWFLKEFSRMEAMLPKKENSSVQQRYGTNIVASPRRGVASPRRGVASPRRGIASPRRGLFKKMKMKLQQGPSNEEVEVRLREDDESITSLFSQGDTSNLRAEITQLKQSLKESQVEAEELKLDRDREKKLREISTKQTSETQITHHDVTDTWAQLSTINEGNDTK